ncbi:MAG: alpha-xylosidase [Actinomycetota bacterium]|nr:alpha-xylosidase [Actinomycetota bacterium]
MKFTDGYWMLREGVQASYPVAVHDVETGEASVTLYAPGYRVSNRGDLLDGPLITLTLSSPSEGVITVRADHFTGGRAHTPQFELLQRNFADVQVRQDDDFLTFTSGPLTARVHLGERFDLRFLLDGREVTGSGFKALAVVTDRDGTPYVREQLDLGVGVNVYGLGERFTPFVKNGQVVEIWNADGGTSSEQAYKNVPFYLTDGGYGVFVDTPARVSFEVASEAVSRVSFSAEGQSLQYHVIAGPTPKEVLRRYTRLTGRPALPPPWSFGLWLSTSFTTDYDERTVQEFLDGMQERDLPLSVFHFDCFWMRPLRWCDFEWDPATFPDPEGMLRRLKERGLRVCVWINPYIAQRSPLFAEGQAAGYLVTWPNGDVWQWDRWQPGMALVDFTNPGARTWYAGKLAALLDQGVDCFKTDFGERIPTDVVWHDGSDPARMHNYYTHLYNRTVFEVLRERRGEGEAVLFARSATAGGQQFPVHWGGDCESTFPSMAETLRGGLSLAASGFGFWSHDIGGFEGTPDPEVFKRWTAFGLLSSHSRLHGSGSYRVPWAFDDEAVDVLRLFTRLKHRLMPYLYQAAVEAAASGVPVLRPMVVEFPDDPACATLERQYLLGPDLLVAPVFATDGEVTYYVPAGRWTRVLSGETVQGPHWVTERHDARSLPLLARPGSVVPFGAVDGRPDYDYADAVVLHVHDLVDGATVETAIPTTTGERAVTFRTTRRGPSLRVEPSRPLGSWAVLLVGVYGADPAPGARAVVEDHGTLLTAEGAAPIEVALPDGAWP